jgi:acyl-CoA ligase (AMP-forming) (exosortase A-associated)
MQVPLTVLDVLGHQGRSNAAEKTAIVDAGRAVAYGELLARSERYGAVLAGANVQKGDRVGIFLRRSAEMAAALFGTWLAGGVAVIVNETLRTTQVRHILEHSEASCVMTDDRQLRSVGELPCPVINVDRPEPVERKRPAVSPIGADLAALIYTSGSTGLPKGVMLSHDNLRSGMEIVSRYLHLTGQDVILSLLPFSFDYGLNQLLTACHAGATLVIQRSLFPPDICRAIQEEKVTGAAGVPTLWLQLTGRVSPFLKSAFPTLRYITNSGGRLPEETVRAIRAAHPHTQIYLMYGLTEAFRSTFLPPDEVDRRPASMGRAIPNVEVLIVDGDGRRCAPGEVGELVHRGANISMGYWRDPAATSRVFRPHPFQECRQGRHEVVVYSGDMVTADAEGFLYYVGRKDVQIKSRGFRVSPEEIERCVHSSNLVSQVVAFAAPRPDGDIDIVVAVVPHDPPRFHPAVLEAFCRQEMPEYMQPRAIWPMADVPLTTSGKPDRPAIQDMYAEYVASARTAAAAARTA